MKKKLFASLLAATALVTLAACGSNNSSSGSGLSGGIIVGGSTAIQPLVTQAAQEFMTDNPDLDITVQGGGSGAGLTGVANGTFQIGNSDVFAEEKSGIDASKLQDHQVAVVGMAPVISNDVAKKVKSITQEELIDIFKGKIKNWSEVGGPNQAITIIGRAEGSGTRSLFETYGLNGGEQLDSAATQDSTGAAAQAVASTPGSISYVSFAGANVDGLSKLAIVFEGESSAVEPTVENVLDNSWKIWGYEHMYTSTSPDETITAFIDYVAASKENVESLGFIAIADMQGTRSVEGDWTEK